MAITTHIEITIVLLAIATLACSTVGIVVTTVATIIQAVRRTTIMVVDVIPQHVLPSITTTRSDTAILATTEITAATTVVAVTITTAGILVVAMETTAIADVA
jgi:hypothetical protein